MQRNKGKTTTQAEVARTTAVCCRVSPQSTGSLPEQERQGIAEPRSHGEGHWSYLDVQDGYSLDRPGLNSLKSDIERGKITKVWVADLTRLSRDPADLESIRTYLVSRKVGLSARG